MNETNIDAAPHKVKAKVLVQPVTRFLASLVVTVIDGRLEVRPAPSAS